MKESFRTPPVESSQESIKHLSPEQEELLESEIAVNIKVINLLKTYFENSFFHTHKESGKQRLYLQFGTGKDNEREKVTILLDLIGIIPYASRDLNELMLDSRFDIEKLNLLGIVTVKPLDDVEVLETNQYIATPHVFGAFPTPRAQKIEPSDKVTNDLFLEQNKNDEETLSVSEYINSNEFYKDELLESLAKERGVYTSIDSPSGFNFLRNQSKFEWRRKENGTLGLFSKKDSREIDEVEQMEVIKQAQIEVQNGAPKKDALNTAVQMHIPLVYFVLNNLLSAGFRIRSLEDSLQEGVIALQRAVERYKPSLGAKLSTYAVQCIEGYMRKYNSEDDTIRIPGHVQYLRSKVRRVGQHMEQVDAQTPTIKEVASLLDLDPEKLENKLHNTMWHQILEPIENYVENVVDEISASPDENILAEQLREEIKDVLNTLSPRERKVLQLHFGLFDREEITLGKIGDQFYVTGGRIQQIESKAFRKLRHPSRSEILKYIFFGEDEHLDSRFSSLDNPSTSIHPNNQNKTTAALHDGDKIEE